MGVSPSPTNANDALRHLISSTYTCPQNDRHCASRTIATPHDELPNHLQTMTRSSAHQCVNKCRLCFTSGLCVPLMLILLLLLFATKTNLVVGLRVGGCAVLLRCLVLGCVQCSSHTHPQASQSFLFLCAHMRR
mmetsp:Transcript_12814/g.35383  ORF Transcript_12814/g.35383 Transcript_12814/m.35383 type:complete len:134 (+) Transcript_12814:1275-1676(+)